MSKRLRRNFSLLETQCNQLHLYVFCCLRDVTPLAREAPEDSLDMSPELNSIVGLFILAVIFSIVGRALTATSRRKKNMREFATKMQYEYSPSEQAASDHYQGFLTTKSTARPEVFNLLTIQDGSVSLCIFDLYYSEMISLGDRLTEVDKKRTVVALSHPEMNLPQFYIRPETGLDKMRGMLKSAYSAASQFKQGLEEMPNQPLQGISIQISRPPEISEWINKTEIQLRDRSDFNNSFWIQGHDEDALHGFLTKPVTECIGSSSDIIWEGFGNTLLLGSSHKLLKLENLPESIEMARSFVKLAVGARSSEA